MGLLRDKFIEDPKKRFLVGLVFDIVLITVFTIMLLSHRQEWYAGYNYCRNLCLMFPELNMSDEMMFKIAHNETNFSFNFSNYNIRVKPIIQPP